MIDEWIVRGWENFVARTTGPLWFRFVFHPVMATLLALWAGWKDARSGRPAFLWSAIFHAGQRGRLFLEALRDTRLTILIAVVLDLIYQLFVLRTVYPLELVFTVTLLAFIPYVLLRGPANRVFRLLKR
jgi:hypothetical protein